MSVAIFHDDELAGLWHVLEPDGEPNSEIQQALGALAYANRAAYLLSYGNRHGDMEPDALVALYDLTLERPCERAGGWKPDALTWVKNLTYNCVSNGGADFAPEASVRTLFLAAHAAMRAAA